MKKTIFIVCLLILIVAFFLGLYLYKINTIDNNLKIGEELIEDECTKFEEQNSIKVNSSENKTSINTKLTIKILYKECNHIKETTELITDESLINLTEEEFRNKYKEWDVQKFTLSEIVIYKEVDDFCNEHYKIQDKDGYITVYQIDKAGNVISEKQTNIAIEYLTNDDIEKIKKGIIVYSTKELNKIIEDYE